MLFNDLIDKLIYVFLELFRLSFFRKIMIENQLLHTGMKQILRSKLGILCDRFGLQCSLNNTCFH